MIKEILTRLVAEMLAVIQSFSMNFAQPSYTQEDVNLLAEVMYHENWSTDPEHLAAYYTGAVIMNRVHSDDWPDTIKGVVYQRGQYAVTKKLFTVKLPEECYEMAESILKNGTDDVPETVVFQATFQQGSGTWKKVKTDYFCYE